MSDQFTNTATEGDRYRAIFENSPVAIWEEDFSEIKRLFDRLRKEKVTDITAYFEQHPEVLQRCAEQVKVIDVNQAALTLHGAKSKKELLAGLVKTFTPESFIAFRNELVSLWNGETSMSTDAEVKTLDGKHHLVTLNYTICPGSEETLSRVFISITDITEQKQAEEALRNEHDRLSNIYATSPVGITMVDRNGQIVEANPQAENVLGLEREAILQLQYNTPALKITALDGSPFPEEQLPFTRVKATGQPVNNVQHAIQWPDGRRVFLSINATPLFDKAGQFDGMIASIEDITERKHAETSVQESEKALNQAQRIAHMGSWYMELATNEVYWSEELYKMYGFDPTLPPPLYTESAKLFTPESWELLSSSIARAVEEGTPYEIELEMKPKGGARKWMLARGELVRDEQGHPIRVRGIAQDITEHKHMEEKLRASEQRFHAIFDQSFQLIGLLSPDGVLLEANQAALGLAGVDKNEVLDKPFWETPWWNHSTELQQQIRTAIQEAAKGKFVRFEANHPDQDGNIHYVDFSLKPVTDSTGRVIQLIPEGHDVTEQKRAATALAASEQQFRSLAENSPDNIVRYDQQCRLIYYNPAMAKTIPYDLDKFLGKTPLEVNFGGLNSSAEYETHIRLVLERGESSDMELLIPDLEGQPRNHLIRFAPELNEQNEVTGVIAIGRDITELKQAEQGRQLHAEFLTNMDRVNRAIQGADNLDTMMSNVLDEVLDILECDRAFLLYPCDPTADAWSIPMERTRPEYPGAGAIGEKIPMDDEVAATLRQLLDTQGVVEFTAASENRPPKDVSERFGIKSFMSVAVYPKAGKPWQFGIHQCSYDRIWTEDEEKLLEEIGRRLSDGLTSLLALRDLRESEARYQRLFDTANEGIWIQDENFVTTFVNEHMANMLGYSVDELQGMKVTEFMTEEDAKDHVRKMDERSRNISDIYERRMHHKDGSDVWLLISATPVFENDRFHGSFAMLTDITTRKKAEQKLATSEQLFRTMVEHSPDYIVRYDRDLQRIYINPALQEQFAVPVEKALGHLPTDTTPLMDPERYMAHIKQAMETGSEYSDEHAYRKPDGEIRWANSRFIPEFDLEGKVATVMVISTDVTERKLTEKELLDARLLFEGVIDQSPVPMALAKPTGELIFNKACADFLHTWDEPTLVPGIKLQEMKQPWKDYDKDGNPLSTMDLPLARALHGEVTKNLELQVERKDGTRRWEMVTGAPIYDNEGNMIAGFVTFPDITERKEAEEALRIHKQHLEEIVEQRTEELRLARDAAESSNKAKSVFLANMSHELRTPLNAILGFSQMMQQDSHLNASEHETLNIINNSGEHLLKLINDVLEIAKIEAGKLQLENATFDLQGLVREVSDMMRLRAEQKGLQLELDQSSEFPRYIMGDEARLRQILVNLISNAVKFTNEGQITIRLSIKNNARHHLVIEIEDTGPGISKEDQIRLFKPFVQLPEGKMHTGTGLGLSIVHQFVQLMKGNIVVKSTPGKGSLFRVELPLNEAEETDVDRLSSVHHGEVTGLAPGQPVYRILIAEDQHDNQLLLTKLMTDIGMEVKTADNGKECVEIFRKWKPDLIWMDHRMPVMDGMEATQRIRNLRDGKKVKIVAVTASAFKEQQSELLDAGMDGFVRKPYQFNEIYDSMVQQLGIQFIYSEETQVAPTPHVLTPARLEVLPATILSELHTAVESLDRTRIKVVINQITELDNELGRALLHMADEFDYPSILDVVNVVAGKSHQT